MMKPISRILKMDRDERLDRKLYAAGDLEGLASLWRSHEKWLRDQALHYCRGNRELADEALSNLGLKLSRRNIMVQYHPQESWGPWANKILQNLVRDAFRAKYRPPFHVTKTNLNQLVKDGIPEASVKKMNSLVGQKYWNVSALRCGVETYLTSAELRDVWATLKERFRSEGRGYQTLHENHASSHRDDGSPEQHMVRNEFLAAYDQGLQELASESRAVLVMKLGLGWSFKRISEVLYGQPNPNLVARTFYKARSELKSKLEPFGPDARREGAQNLASA